MSQKIRSLRFGNLPFCPCLVDDQYMDSFDTCCSTAALGIIE